MYFVAQIFMVGNEKKEKFYQKFKLLNYYFH